MWKRKTIGFCEGQPLQLVGGSATLQCLNFPSLSALASKAQKAFLFIDLANALRYTVCGQARARILHKPP